jgi:cell division septation protein DedD
VTPVFPVARSGEARFTDEQVFAILRAADAHDAGAAEFCRDAGITVPIYCVWKARYGRLSLDELRAARRTEQRRARARQAWLGAAVVLALGTLGAWLLPGGAEPPAAAAAATPEQAAPPVVRDAAPEPAIEPEPAPRIERATAASAGPERAATAAAPGPAPFAAPADERGYSVQVAAAPDLQQARRLVERLSAAGHEAYAVPAVVGSAGVVRVRVGPFASRPEAEAAARHLAREGYAGAWIAAPATSPGRP